jgi:hypothetical protein
MSSKQPTQLGLDYRPSQPTGWEFGDTIGGHHSDREFKIGAKRYRIALLAFGQPGSSPSPVYESVPGDPTVAYKRTLERKFGAYYSFRYRGGFKGQREFSVQCYSVFAKPQQMSFGAQLYLVYEPDVHAGDPPAEAQLGWIQVARWSGTGAPSRASYVDGGARPSPFFISGGLISILGTRVFNFDNPITVQGQASGGAMSATYLAETFLTRDTLTKDAAGKDVIEIFGGIKYGWKLREVRR